MTIYIVLFLYFVFSAFIFDGRKPTHAERLNWILVFIIFFLLSGLRYRIGGDSIWTEDQFDEYGLDKLKYDLHFTFLDRRQPLWMLLCSLINIKGGGFLVLQLIQSFVVNISIFSYLSKYSRHKYCVVTLYYLLWYQYYTTEVLREGFAVAIFLFALDYMIQKKWIKYYFYILLAIMFHSSALILIVLPFIYNMNIGNNVWKTFWVLIPLMILIFVLDFSSFYNGDISTYQYRLLTSAYFASKSNFYGILYNLVFRLFPYMIMLYELKRLNMNNQRNQFLIFVTCLFASIAVILPQSSRYLNYVHIAYLVLLVEMVFESCLDKNKVWLLFVIGILIFNRFDWYFHDYSNLTGQKGDCYYHVFIPYSSVLNPQMDKNRERVAYYNHLYMGE